MYLLAFAESIQLFPDGTLFLHIALILLMIWTLNRTFFKPINRIIESREAHKGGRGGEAEKILADVEKKTALYNKELLDARSRGYEWIEKENLSAVAEREKQLAAAKSEVASQFAEQRKELERQASEARAAIGTEAERFADKISANILKV